MSDRRLPGGDLRVVLRPAIVSTSSPQVLAEDLVPSLLAGRSGAVVVDLGCGGGDSVEVFRVGRVLRSGGIFAGSTSHQEPFHGYSIANFTPTASSDYLSARASRWSFFCPASTGRR